MVKKSTKLYKIEDDIDNYYDLENGWWIYNGMSRDNSIQVKYYRGIRYQEDKSKPRLCPECNYAWSREYDSTTKTTASILLPDFPKYKLEKHVCYFCKPNQ